MSDTFLLELTRDEICLVSIALDLFKPASQYGPKVKAAILDKIEVLAREDADPPVLEPWPTSQRPKPPMPPTYWLAGGQTVQVKDQFEGPENPLRPWASPRTPIAKTEGEAYHLT